MMEKKDGKLVVGLAQLAPVWLDKKSTLKKIVGAVHDAGKNGIDLLVFGEGFVPGYPFWIGLTPATEFDSPMQKELHAHYAANAVNIDKGDLVEICSALKDYEMASYLGVIERPNDRGGHSLYASLVYHR